MAGLSIWHIALFAIVLILLFGTSKLKNIGKDLGGAVKDFKKSVKDEDSQQPAQLHHERTVEGSSNPVDQASNTPKH